jgi:hypothetical protein
MHDPGKIVADLAANLALGGDGLAGIALLPAQPEPARHATDHEAESATSAKTTTTTTTATRHAAPPAGRSQIAATA